MDVIVLCEVILWIREIGRGIREYGSIQNRSGEVLGGLSLSASD